MVAGSEDDFAAPDWVLNGGICTGEPICSLVIAPYEAAPWVGRRTMKITIRQKIRSTTARDPLAPEVTA
jgi:hypothetical protein